MQNVEKIRFRMSSEVVWPVRLSSDRRAPCRSARRNSCGILFSLAISAAASEFSAASTACCWRSELRTPPVAASPSARSRRRIAARRASMPSPVNADVNNQPDSCPVKRRPNRVPRSDLFRTTTWGRPSSDRSSFVSSSATGAVASSTTTTRSASASASRERAIPRASASSAGDSPDRRSPAVSISRSGIPPTAVASSTVSRVVPGSGVTMARSRSQQPIEERALAYVGAADKRQRRAFAQPVALGVAPLQPLQRVAHLAEDRPNLLRRDDVDVVQLAGGEVHAGLQQSDERDQLLFDRGHAPRQRPAELLRGHACLLQRLCGDQVLHGLGLGQVDAAIQEGALGELSRACQSRTRRQRRAEQRLEHHGRAMGRDLDYILPGVGVRSGERRHDGLVDGCDPENRMGPECRPGPARRREWREPASSGRRGRTSWAAISQASGPESRTMPMPPRPGGVATAAMVSVYWRVLSTVLIPSGCYIAPADRQAVQAVVQANCHRFVIVERQTGKISHLWKIHTKAGSRFGPRGRLTRSNVGLILLLPVSHKGEWNGTKVAHEDPDKPPECAPYCGDAYLQASKKGYFSENISPTSTRRSCDSDAGNYRGAGPVRCFRKP